MSSEENTRAQEYMNSQYERAESLIDRLHTGDNVREAVRFLKAMYDGLNQEIGKDKSALQRIRLVDDFKAGDELSLFDKPGDLTTALAPLHSQIAIALHYAQKYHPDEVEGVLDDFNVSYPTPY